MGWLICRWNHIEWLPFNLLLQMHLIIVECGHFSLHLTVILLNASFMISFSSFLIWVRTRKLSNDLYSFIVDTYSLWDFIILLLVINEYLVNIDIARYRGQALCHTVINEVICPNSNEMFSSLSHNLFYMNTIFHNQTICITFSREKNLNHNY